MSSQFQMVHLLYPTEKVVVLVMGGAPLNNCQLFFKVIQYTQRDRRQVINSPGVLR